MAQVALQGHCLQEKLRGPGGWAPPSCRALSVARSLLSQHTEESARSISYWQLGPSLQSDPSHSTHSPLARPGHQPQLLKELGTIPPMCLEGEESQICVSSNRLYKTQLK